MRLSALTPSERRAVVIIGDLLLLTMALLLAYGIWAYRGDHPFTIAFLKKKAIWFVLSPIWFFLAAVGGLYEYRNLVSLERTLRGFATCGAIILISYTLLYFFAPKESLPRGVVLYHAFFSVGLVGGWRYLLLLLHGNPLFRRRCVVVAKGEEREGVISFLDQYPFYEVVGVSAEAPEMIVPLQGGDSVDLPSFVRTFDVDEILVTAPVYSDREVTKAIVFCGEKGITVTPFPLLYEELTGRVPIDHIREGWWHLLPFRVAETGMLYPMLKRTADVIGAILGLSFLGLTLPWVALAIKLDSKGPVFYRQVRVGRGGRTFTVWKLRTMRADAERGKAVWAKEKDPRVTRVGRWLRKARFDEFPQCWNILKGEMSIIGPRPERPEFVKELRDLIPFFELRHSVKPGMAGWAMVNHGYVATVEDAKARLEYDLYYIKHQSLWFDALIFLRALLQLFLFRGR